MQYRAGGTNGIGHYRHNEHGNGDSAGMDGAIQRNSNIEMGEPVGLGNIETGNMEMGIQWDGAIQRHSNIEMGNQWEWAI